MFYILSSPLVWLTFVIILCVNYLYYSKDSKLFKIYLDDKSKDKQNELDNLNNEIEKLKYDKKELKIKMYEPKLL